MKICPMKKPNLFIVGAARSGTTSLWQYLKVHPEIYMPEDELHKEPSFFSDIRKDLTLDKYLALFERANESYKWIGEASVAYITDPLSASRIHEFDPSAKIIIMLRNPAERAYSLYNWMVQDGYEYASSFEEALKLEETRLLEKQSTWYKPNYYWGYLYFRSGLYHDQVKRYLELFKDNVLIITFEDFINDPGSSYRQVCFFLEINATHVPFHIHNPSHAVRSAKLLFVLRKLNNYIINENRQGKALNKISETIKGEYEGIVDKLSKITRLRIPDKIRGKIILKKVTDYLNSLPEQYPYKETKTKEDRDRLLNFGLKVGKPAKLRGKTRINLLSKYAPDVERLSHITGIDFPGWSM